MSAVARVMEDFAAVSMDLPKIVPQRNTEKAPPTEVIEVIGQALLARLGPQRYELWFGRKTRLKLAGDMLVVEAPNVFAANWIRSKFIEDLRAAAAEVLQQNMKIQVNVGSPVAVVDADSRDSVADGADVAQPVAMPVRSAVPSSSAAPSVTLNAKYKLEEFVVGPSNQLAYHAALQVAQNPGTQYNPLFFHGHCGLGKTHLLQGICQKFARLHPGKKWLYLTGESFTNEFLEAIKSHRTDAFRKRIRNADLLVIDDVHFLANKRATQEEFLHTFNQVDACGKQIVLASDCAPKQIQALSESLTSRFVSGMVLRIDAPDLPTRLEILRRRVARNGWKVSDSVLMHVAQSAASSVRELEGLLFQVMAGMSLINSGSPEAGDVVAQIKDRTAMAGHGGGPVQVDRIVQAVAEYFAVGTQAMMGSGREKTPAIARAIAMHLARQQSGMSFPELGRAFGGRNHSTVIAACQRVDALVTAGELLCWNTPEGPRHQAIADVLHDLEASVRRGK